MERQKASPPFGMDPAMPAFSRATNIAAALFGDVEAAVVLMDGDRTWRSAGRLAGEGEPASGSRWVAQSGKLVWLADRAEDPRWRTKTYDLGRRRRFFAGAPIRLANGQNIGAIRVHGREPRPYDGQLAARLQELADGIADECERARANEAAAAAQRELSVARGVLSAFVNTVPVSVVMTDSEFRVLAATPRWLENFDLDMDEAQGRSVFDLSPDFYVGFQPLFQLALEGEVIKRDRVRAFHRQRRDWLQVELAPWRDDSGRIGGVIFAAHEITKMVEALRQVERVQQRLQLAAEAADINVFEVDYRRRTIETSGAGLMSPEDPAQRDALFKSVFTNFGLDLVDPRDHPVVIEAWRRHEEDGKPFRAEFRMGAGGSERIWVSEVLRPIKNDEGHIVRIVGARQDISARKEADLALIRAKETAEAANRAKSAFLATMSHEIRTPLNGVIGMAQALAAEAMSPVQRERVEVIRQSGESLLAILNDVLDLSKIEAAKLELEDVEFDIEQLVAGVQMVFQPVAAKKGVGLDVCVAPSGKGVYRGDPTRIRQILSNLVSNGVKFTAVGTVTVSVDRRGRWLQLSVADTGIGISRSQRGALFRKFEQADPSTTRRFGGTGLGLAICKELAVLMGGRIHVRSRPDEGSVFTASLPLPKVARAMRPAAVEPSMAPSADLGLKVLAAEDNDVNQVVLKTLLAQFGIDPTFVGDGVEAVAAWEAQEWDVILMDVQMPRMDGPTATRFIRERERARGRRRTPIIALTANAMTHQVSEYLAADMDGIVAKPIEAGRLIATLQQVLAAADASQVA